MSENELKQKAKEIEKIYQEYINKMEALKGEQNKIIDDFIAELEKAKIADLTSKLKN